jgi:hypothetical protein
MRRPQKPGARKYRYIPQMMDDQAIQLCIERYQKCQVALGTERDMGDPYA